MQTTVKAHWNRGSIAFDHNARDYDLCINEFHIDLLNEHGLSFHEQVYHKGLTEVYQDLFGDALEEYNAKQKRKDRRMTMHDYMESIQNDTRGKKQTVKKNGKRVRKDNLEREGKQLAYEITFSVGNTERLRDEYGRTVYDNNGNIIMTEMLPRDLQALILDRYYEGWQERNPNLKLVSVDRHADEGFYNKLGNWEYGVVHDHFVVVPWHTGYKQGLSIQNSMNKAMSDMGFKGADCYEQWNKREEKILEQITLETYREYCLKNPEFSKIHGSLTIHHPVHDNNKSGGMTKEQYVKQQELLDYEGELKAWEHELKKKDYQLSEHEASLTRKQLDYAVKKGVDDAEPYRQRFLDSLIQYIKELQISLEEIQQIADDIRAYRDDLTDEGEQREIDDKLHDFELRVKPHEDLVAKVKKQEMLANLQSGIDGEGQEEKGEKNHGGA